NTAVNGTTYFYKVTAVNATASTASNQVSGTPQAPLAAPSVPTLSATAGNATVGLSWTAGAGGGAVSGWSVYRSTTNPVVTTGVPLVTRTAAQLSYTDNAVNNGTTYYYKVTADNATASTDSNQVTGAPALPAPSAPTLSA